MAFRTCRGKHLSPRAWARSSRCPNRGAAFMQLLLDVLTEMEKPIDLKTAGDLAEAYYKIQQLDIKDYFPLQKQKWNPNITVEREKAGKLSGMDSKRGAKSHSQNSKLASLICNQTGSP